VVICFANPRKLYFVHCYMQKSLEVKMFVSLIIVSFFLLFSIFKWNMFLLIRLRVAQQAKSGVLI
jgi:hypothetical protein